MRNIRVGVILAAIVGLTACDTLEESTARGQNGLQKNYNTTRQHIAKWIYDPEKNRLPDRPAVLPRYCYQVLTDILCYSTPQPRLRNQLVNYQGDGALPPYYAEEQTYVVDNTPQSSTVEGTTIQSTDLPPPVTTTGTVSNNGAPTTLMHGF